VRTEGVRRGLYKAVGVTVLRAGILNAAQLVTYDTAKHALIRHSNSGVWWWPSILGVWHDALATHFVASFASGFMTAACSNPVDVVRTRVMNEHMVHGPSTYSSNPFRTAALIYRTEGAIGLYKGFGPAYLRLGTGTVIALVISEQIRLLAGIKTI